MGTSNENINDLIKKSSNKEKIILSLVKDKNREYIPVSILSAYLDQLINTIYQYNFVILKNDDYKKIVVAFPGLTFYFQILDELLNAGMTDLPIKSNYKKKTFAVLEIYYKIFVKLEKDLYDNLASLSGINRKDYKLFFIGHSIGGVIATIYSFYYIKKFILLQKIF